MSAVLLMVAAAKVRPSKRAAVWADVWARAVWAAVWAAAPAAVAAVAAAAAVVAVVMVVAATALQVVGVREGTPWIVASRMVAVLVEVTSGMEAGMKVRIIGVSAAVMAVCGTHGQLIGCPAEVAWKGSRAAAVKHPVPTEMAKQAEERLLALVAREGYHIAHCLHERTARAPAASA